MKNNLMRKLLKFMCLCEDNYRTRNQMDFKHAYLAYGMYDRLYLQEKVKCVETI